MKAEILQLTREQYDELDAVNWSTLKYLLRSPAHYRERLLQKESKDTDAMAIGRCTHLAVLEPEKFATGVAVWDGGRRDGNAWDVFCAANRGKELLTLKQYQQVMNLARAVRADKVAGKYFQKGQAELSIRWEAEGIVIKSRLDFVSGSFFPACIVDLKTTKDASPTAFGKAAYDMGMHIQAAMYQDAYASATGDKLRVALVAAEKDGPHCPVVFRVPDELLDMGRGQYIELLRILAECRATNSWPGYAVESELELELPRWAFPKDEDEGEAFEDLDLVVNQ